MEEQSNQVIELWAGKQAGDTWFSNLGVAMDDTGQVSDSLGLSLQPVCALRGLVFCKAVFEFGGSTQLLMAMVHNDHKMAGNCFSSEVCRLNK